MTFVRPLTIFLSILLAGFGTHGWKPGDALPYSPFLEKYDADTGQLFPRLIRAFDQEFCQRRDDQEACLDVLGEFYELHFNEKPPHCFLPWSTCRGLARDFMAAFAERDDRTPVMAHNCGSGRMLLAIADELGFGRPYYGADTNLLCAKMTAIQLFMAGIAEGEVVCGNPLVDSESFVAGWKITREPHGVFPMLTAAESVAWKVHVRDAAAGMTSELDEDGGIGPDGLHLRFEA